MKYRIYRSEAYTLFLAHGLTASDGAIAAMEDVLARYPDAAAVTGVVADEGGQILAAGGDVTYAARLLPRAWSETSDAVKRVGAPSPGVVAMRSALVEIPSVAEEVDDEFIVGAVLSFVEAGQSIYCQPFARFVAAESYAQDRDGEPWEAARRRAALREEFDALFSRSAISGDFVDIAPKKQLLFIDCFIPKPDRDSGSVDAWWYIKIFQRLGFDVSFIATLEKETFPVYEDALRKAGVSVRYESDPARLRDVVHREAPHLDLIFVQRVYASRYFIQQLKALPSAPPVIFGAVDIHFLRETRGALLEHSISALDQALAVRRDEVRSFSLADASIVVSRAEFDLVKALLPACNLHRIPIPRLPGKTSTPFGERSGVIFVGGYGHLPNVDAVKFLAREVWPLVHAKLPALTLEIVGSGVTEEIRALADPLLGIRVTGFVSDIGEVFSRSRLSVAPLRFGAGIKGKIVSSLLHGVPCVATSIAAEGMGLVHDEHILVADEPADIASAIVTLHENPETWSRIASGGYACAEAEYSVARVADGLRMVLESVGVTVQEMPADAEWERLQ